MTASTASVGSSAEDGSESGSGGGSVHGMFGFVAARPRRGFRLRDGFSSGEVALTPVTSEGQEMVGGRIQSPLMGSWVDVGVKKGGGVVEEMPSFVGPSVDEASRVDAGMRRSRDLPEGEELESMERLMLLPQDEHVGEVVSRSQRVEGDEKTLVNSSVEEGVLRPRTFDHSTNLSDVPPGPISLLPQPGPTFEKLTEFFRRRSFVSLAQPPPVYMNPPPPIDTYIAPFFSARPRYQRTRCEEVVGEIQVVKDKVNMLERKVDMLTNALAGAMTAIEGQRREIAFLNAAVHHGADRDNADDGKRVSENRDIPDASREVTASEAKEREGQMEDHEAWKSFHVRMMNRHIGTRAPRM